MSYDHSPVVLHSSTAQPSTALAPPPPLPSSYGIIIPLSTFTLAGLLCFLLFCWFRTVFKDIYSPRLSLRQNRPPPLSNGFLGWIPRLYGISESQILQSVGLDGILFLRFMKMGYRFFTILSITCLSIIAPIHYYSSESPPKWEASTGLLWEDVLLPALSVTNVPSNSPLLRIHLLFTWIISLVTYWLLLNYLNQFLHLKLLYDRRVLGSSTLFEAPSKIEDRTIIAFAIPKGLRHEMDLAAYFEGLGVGKVENVVLCRRWTRLRKAVKKRAEFLYLLEMALVRTLYNHASRTQPSISQRLLKIFGKFKCSCCGKQSSDVDGYSSIPDRSAASSPFSSISDEGASGHSSTTHIPIPFSTHHQSATQVVAFEVKSIIDAIEPSCRPTISLTGNKQYRRRAGMEDGSLSPPRSPPPPNKRSRLCCCSSGVKKRDAIMHYLEQFQYWDDQVAKLRRSPELSAATRVAFITFKDPLSAVLASQVPIHSNPFSLRIRLAPEPRDVYWNNLSSLTAHDHIKLARSFFVMACLFLLVFFSTAVVTTIAGLIDLDQLASFLPGLKAIIDGLSENRVQFIQGVIPTILLSGWTSCLPTILLYLCQMQGLEALSWIEISLLTKYFFYQLWNVLFVQVLFRAILFDILKSPSQLIDLLGQMIPKSAPILINYVMLQAVAVYPAQLVLAGPLLMTWFTRLAPWNQSSPRQIANSFYPSVLTSVNYGIAYPVPILLFVIGLVYAPITPLILPFTALFFALTYFIYKYMLLYVHLKGYESRGAASLLAVKCCFVGIVIFQFSMMGVLALKAIGTGSKGPGLAFEGLPWSGYIQMVVGVSPLIFMTGLLYVLYVKRIERLILCTPLEVVAHAQGRLKINGHRTDSMLQPLDAVPPAGNFRQPNPERSPRVTGSADESDHLSDGSSRLGAEDEENTGDQNESPHDDEPSLFESYFRRSRASVEVGDGEVDTDPEQGYTAEMFFEPVHHDPSLGWGSGTDVRNQTTNIYVETPCTRVPGILDTGFQLLAEGETRRIGVDELRHQSSGPSATLSRPLHPDQRYEEGPLIDPLTHSYIHPAFVGLLPMPWFPLPIQPRELTRVRIEQMMSQSERMHKWMARQRLGMESSAEPI